MSLGHRIRPLAEDEITESVGFYERRRVGLGWDFFAAVREAIARAADTPESCARLRSPPDMTIRFVPVRGFPFKVVFLHEPEQVVVLAVAHDRRRPGYWRDRI